MEQEEQEEEEEEEESDEEDDSDEDSSDEENDVNLENYYTKEDIDKIMADHVNKATSDFTAL